MSVARDDEALAAAWQAGDRDAGSALVARLVAPLRRYFGTRLSPRAAEDLCQETLARLCVAIVRFRFDSSVRTYVYRIANRVLCDHLRYRGSGRGRRDLATCSFEELEGPLGLDAREFGEDPELLDIIHALRKLPARDQQLFELRHIEGLSYAEIITLLELACKPGTLRVRVYAIRQELRRLLGAEVETPRGDETGALVCRRSPRVMGPGPERALVGQLRARLDAWIRRRRVSRSWA